MRVTNRLLQTVQVQALTNPTEELFQQEKDLYDKWCFLRTTEESYFKQRSRVNWLKEGDFNTAYFHRLVQVHASFNSIRSFTLPSGELITDPVAMGIHAVAHFQSLLVPLTVPISTSSLDWFQSLIHFRCSAAQAQSMVILPGVEEITKVIMKLNANKAPGPDGLTSGFFKAAWTLIGAETVNAVKGFFSSGFLPSAANSTILTLVPKRPGASAIGDFRPIS